MPREAGAGDRSGGVRRVAERKTHLEAEDALEGGRCIGRRKMHRKAEEAEAEFEMERRGGRGFPLQPCLSVHAGEYINSLLTIDAIQNTHLDLQPP